MKKNYVVALFLILAGLSIGVSWVFSQAADYLWETTDDNDYELIEEFAEYNSSINWTKGKIRTEISVPIEEDNVNIGKSMNTYYTQIKNELRQNLIKAMGYIRVSDIFLLKDYYSMKNDIRYEIISYSDKAFYYPPTQSKNRFWGTVELKLFGNGGIANIFYRDIDKIKMTNYVDENLQNQEFFDGLVIDNIVYENFNPSLQLRIFDQNGNLLYGPETVQKEVLENFGICEYTTSLFYAFNSPRSGSRIYYIVPYSIRGKMNTEIVLHNRDAARLFANPKTVAFLNQSRVVVVVPPKKKK